MPWNSAACASINFSRRTWEGTKRRENRFSGEPLLISIQLPHSANYLAPEDSCLTNEVVWGVTCIESLSDDVSLFCVNQPPSGSWPYIHQPTYKFYEVEAVRKVVFHGVSLNKAGGIEGDSRGLKLEAYGLFIQGKQMPLKPNMPFM